METMSATDQEFLRRRNRGRWMLILLALLFIGPLLLAFALYYGDIWRPAGMAVHGTLIEPPRPLPELSLTPGGDTRLQGRWTLLLVAPGDCPQTCRTALYETRQMRRALGKELDRVQRLWISEGQPPAAAFLAEEHPDLAVMPPDQPGHDELLSLIGPTAPGEVLVVDPHGNLMMRFAPDTTMRAMHTDMKRLLKVSRIG